ncbi:MAG: transporter substrate-binding domain-containing protein [Planctomycetota bacterium]|jgi:ABC-type amino acid transport substrate-binding protein
MLSRLSVAPVLALLAAVFIAPPAALGQDTSPELVIGTKEAPPFSRKDAGGNWSGLSIELWRQVAEELKLAYRFEERTLEGLMSGIEEGRLDASVAALTITESRETRLDFTHPFHTSGLAIAVRSRHEGSAWTEILEAAFSVRFFQALGALLAVLLVAALLVWVFEHRRNPEQFGGGPGRGLGKAFWWSAVTMTTVGYGDLAPKTLGGRVVALVWMFTSVVIVSSFTASIASSLTVNEFRHDIEGPGDLNGRVIGTVVDSTSWEWAVRESDAATVQKLVSVDQALSALAKGDVDAVVYDAPVLHNSIRERFPRRLALVPGIFERQDYGIALPAGSELREPINRAMLRILASPAWRETRRRHLGE